SRPRPVPGARLGPDARSGLPDNHPDPRPDVRPEVHPEVRRDALLETHADPYPGPYSDPRTDPRTATRPGPASGPYAAPELCPQGETCPGTATHPRAASPRTPGAPGACAGADPRHTLVVIDDLLARIRKRRRLDGFDLLAAHRLRERRELLRRYAHRRPAPGSAPTRGWVHGDFHPLNVLYAGTAPHEPLAIVDWDRLDVQPLAEEVVRAGVIFFLRPDGTLDLTKLGAYARAYRAATGAGPAELAAAVHRVWWERLNDFWMLRWRYHLRDHRTDAQFPAAAALVVWWTAEYPAVRDAFCE
ncbi:phosphotransferase, partial [Streptomyces alkaliterrae]